MDVAVWYMGLALIILAVMALRRRAMAELRNRNRMALSERRYGIAWHSIAMAVRGTAWLCIAKAKHGSARQWLGVARHCNGMAV